MTSIFYELSKKSSIFCICIAPITCLWPCFAQVGDFGPEIREPRSPLISIPGDPFLDGPRRPIRAAAAERNGDWNLAVRLQAVELLTYPTDLNKRQALIDTLNRFGIFLRNAGKTADADLQNKRAEFVKTASDRVQLLSICNMANEVSPAFLSQDKVRFEDDIQSLTKDVLQAPRDIAKRLALSKSYVQFGDFYIQHGNFREGELQYRNALFVNNYSASALKKIDRELMRMPAPKFDDNIQCPLP